MSPPRPAVLITGAARRIGAAMARTFAAAGWHVVVHCHRSQDAAHELVASLASAEVIVADLTDVSAAEDMVAACGARLADWRALICSAALFEADDAMALDAAVFERAMAINTLAPVAMAQAYFRHARTSAGRAAVLVTDQKLANPNPDFFSYSLSKHALGAAVTMLSMAARGPADRIYGLAPGAILASHDQSEAEIEVSHRLNLLHRKTAASEIADAAVFLAEGALASGETLFVDSGQHLLAQDRDVIFLARAMEGHR